MGDFKDFHDFLSRMDFRALWSLWSLVMIAVAVGMDVVWALYIRRSAQGKAFSSANYAALIILFGVLNVVSYMSNPAYLISILVGSWFGTFFMVKRDAKKTENSNG